MAARAWGDRRIELLFNGCDFSFTNWKEFGGWIVVKVAQQCNVLNDSDPHT